MPSTYGYRRIHEMCNRHLLTSDKKRVYRNMKQNQLLSARHTGKKPPGNMKDRLLHATATCAGVLMYLKFPSGMVSLAFSLDCCDVAGTKRSIMYFTDLIKPFEVWIRSEFVLVSHGKADNICSHGKCEKQGDILE